MRNIEIDTKQGCIKIETFIDGLDRRMLRWEDELGLSWLIRFPKGLQVKLIILKVAKDVIEFSYRHPTTTIHHSVPNKAIGDLESFMLHTKVFLDAVFDLTEAITPDKLKVRCCEFYLPTVENAKTFINSTKRGSATFRCMLTGKRYKVGSTRSHDELIKVVLTTLTKVQEKSITKDMILRSQSFTQQCKRK